MSHKMKKGKREKIRKKLKKELGDFALPTGRPVILHRFIDPFNKIIEEEKNMADGSYNLMDKREAEANSKPVVCCEHDLSENVEAYEPEKDAAECGMDMVRRSERNGRQIKIVYLYDTAALMCSHDYRTRFVAEYYQTKIRYEKLKAFNTKIEAANRMMDPPETCVRRECKKVDMPKHDCPDSMLRAQERAMEEYLHILELRAVIEGIDLEQYK